MKEVLFRELVNKVKSDRFLANSFIFFVGSFLASFGNYLFHFLMARMLSVEAYGELQSLIAIFVVFCIPMAALSTVLVQYTAHFKAREQLNKVYTLFSLFTKKILMVAGVFSALFFLFHLHIANFLNLDSGLPVIILGLSFLPTFLSSINTGIIQGLEKFKSASIITIIVVSFKVFLAVLLVSLGFAVNGAIGAIVLATVVGYFITFLPVRFLLKQEKEKIDTRKIFQYFFPVLFTVLFLNLLYNIDIILVKHFLPSHIAGEYGALVTVCRIIFFLAGPITGVMFPMAARALTLNSNPARILKKSIFLVSLLGFGTVVFYFLFPNFVIKIVVGSKFLSISEFLGCFGVAMFLYSLVHLFSQYFLSVRKTKCACFLAIAVLIQVILISLWHSNLWQIVWIMNGIMFTTLTLLLVYYKKTKNDYA